MTHLHRSSLGCLALLALAASPTGAAIISGATSYPPVATPPAPGVGVPVAHTFSFSYIPGATADCGARLAYSDNAPGEDVTLKKGVSAMTRVRHYLSAATVTASLSGLAHSGLPACPGGASTTVVVKPPACPQAAALASSKAPRPGAGDGAGGNPNVAAMTNTFETPKFGLPGVAPTPCGPGAGAGSPGEAMATQVAPH